MTGVRQAFPAPAKLNLFLHVLGRRPDGYHELQTLFRFIDRDDTLHVAVREDGRIVREKPLPGVSEEADLCLRAARLLQAETGTPLGADIALEKRLPMGGGLGGGSSDAATVLLALNHLWGLGLSRQRLQELGLRLGADVPFFVFGRNALAGGVGEALQAVDLPEAWYVVLVPPVAVPTAEIFADTQLTRDSRPIKMAAFFAGGGHNDLESVACRLYPEVARYMAWLGRFGQARMSGSGASVFAAFASQQEAQAVIEALPHGMTGWVARGMQRHPLYHLVSD